VSSCCGRIPAHRVSLGSISLPIVSASLVIGDCPKCRGRGTVVLGTYPVCMACFAEFSEDDETISYGGEEAASLPTLGTPFARKARAPRRG